MDGFCIRITESYRRYGEDIDGANSTKIVTALNLMIYICNKYFFIFKDIFNYWYLDFKVDKFFLHININTIPINIYIYNL